MALSAEAQALFDHAKSSLPRWLFAGARTVTEWLFASVEALDVVRLQVKDWYDQSFILNATGRYLDQHAKDRGTSRRDGEDDDTLRQRLREIEDAVTYPAIEAGVNRILDAAGISADCEILIMRRQSAYMHAPSQVTSFISRGARMTVVAPGTYIVILPAGTSATVAAAVEEYLRQFGPAGYNHFVEIRP